MSSAIGEVLLTLQWQLNSHFALKIKEPYILMSHAGQGFCQGKGRSHVIKSTLPLYHTATTTGEQLGGGLGKITKTFDNLIQKPPKF